MRYHATVAAGEGGFRSIDRRKNFCPGPLALLPQNKRFFYRVFFALKPPACDGLADERFLVGGEAHIHSLNVGIPGGRVNATEVDGDALLPVLAVTDLQGWMDGRVTTMPAEEQRQVFAIPCDLSACKLDLNGSWVWFAYCGCAIWRGNACTEGSHGFCLL
jgi:hypothetical protein